MTKYIIRRLFIAIPTVFFATLLVFTLLRIIPGDVAEMLVQGEEGRAAQLPFTVETLRRELGLDRPLYIQYITWLGDVVRGDLGDSLWTKRSVGREILHRLPITVQLAVMAQVLSLLIGIPVGIISAIKQDSPVDMGLRFWSILFLAMPSFWVGLLFLYVTVSYLAWSPPLGYFPIWDDSKNNILQLGPPALVLATAGLAQVARMTRSSMLEVLREDYIRTARSKGLAERLVLQRHALRNALIPVVTFSSITFAHLLSGTVVLETVFSVPGLGSYFLESLRVRDYTVVQAMVLFSVMAVIVINLFIDLLYGWLDPRISYSD